MITFMRRYRRTLQIGLLVIVAAFVASLFIFGTSARDGGAARDSVATVNGEKISVERYQRRYQEYLSMYAQMMRDRFSPRPSPCAFWTARDSSTRSSTTC